MPMSRFEELHYLAELMNRAITMAEISDGDTPAHLAEFVGSRIQELAESASQD